MYRYQPLLLRDIARNLNVWKHPTDFGSQLWRWRSIIQFAYTTPRPWGLPLVDRGGKKKSGKSLTARRPSNGVSGVWNLAGVGSWKGVPRAKVKANRSQAAHFILCVRERVLLLLTILYGFARPPSVKANRRTILQLSLRPSLPFSDKC